MGGYLQIFPWIYDLIRNKALPELVTFIYFMHISKVSAYILIEKNFTWNLGPSSDLNLVLLVDRRFRENI